MGAFDKWKKLDLKTQINCIQSVEQFFGNEIGISDSMRDARNIQTMNLECCNRGLSVISVKVYRFRKLSTDVASSVARLRFCGGEIVTDETKFSYCSRSTRAQNLTLRVQPPLISFIKNGA